MKTENKEIMRSFKKVYSIPLARGEYDDVWVSDLFPGYKIVYQKRFSKSQYRLYREMDFCLYDEDENKTPIKNIGLVLAKDVSSPVNPSNGTYSIKDGEAVFNLYLRDFLQTDAPEKEEIEYYKKHPEEIAKERFCYCTLKKGVGENRLFMKVVPAVLDSLYRVDRDVWLDKTYTLHPCEGSQCPYNWCCVRHEVKSSRKYDKMKYCV